VARHKDSLGSYLRNRRTRLDPAAFGLADGRRRTPGLRREEVAQRANISPTWYTWLEQGRGGAPSAAVLDRIVTEPEREHLFMLGLGRPPEVRYKPAEGVTPRLQRVLDAMEFSPAIIKTATWNVVGWNKAAAALITDYSKLPREERNILRLMFGSRIRAKREDWSDVARFVVGAFRADVARAGAGASDEVFRLVEELCRLSPEFGALWQNN
jgi:transcriptional regulator with XRE-family HTH domain